MYGSHYLHQAKVTISVLEGDYSSYSEKWNQVITGGDQITTGEFFVSGDKVFFTDLSTDDYKHTAFIRALADGAAIDADEVTYALYNRDADTNDASVLSKYVVRHISDSSFEVWKDGGLLQTITIPGSGPIIQGLNITYDGHYILVCDVQNETVYLYEGS